jgi:hypothetical protein
MKLQRGTSEIKVDVREDLLRLTRGRRDQPDWGETDASVPRLAGSGDEDR